jgi:hypothetical protein
MVRLIATLLAFLLLSTEALGQSVYIARDASLPESKYASRRLSQALESRGLSVVATPRRYDYLISLAVNDHRLKKEAFAIVPEGRALTVYGGDPRGMIYGALALAEDVRNGIALGDVKARTEQARLPFRAIKHNLPWDSYRSSQALDQHTAATKDLTYWEAFLDMMVDNRFNALTLWNLHPWTYMIRPRNFPEASPFSDKELVSWRHLHQGIFRMAKERGIDTYLVPWNIFVSKEFAQAHNVGLKNVYPYYNTTGDTSELIRRYVRESVAQTLEEYPDLTGMGLSHSEGMAGMTAEARQEWIDDTYVAAMRSLKRPVKIIEKLPSSSGVEMGGSTSRETELLTRRTLEAIDFADGPVWLAGKFNWSHGHSTPTLVGVHGGGLGDTYFKPEPKNYKFTWIVRNEDFFALRWGVPSFVREHIQKNGTQSYMGGYIIGSETYIPALDYFTAVKTGTNWHYAFERQWLFYKLWGRLLYDPATPDTVFAEEFVRRYGPKGGDLLRAYELASRTPLRLASLFASTWDHTLYSEGFMWLDEKQEVPKMAYISVDSLIKQKVLDPAYVNIADYVAGRAKGQAFAADRVTPPVLADRIEADCREALRLADGIAPGGNVALMYEVADVKTWSHLGLHLAEKLRGGVALQTYRQSGGEENKARAIRHMENALAQWDEVVRITRPIYRDMLLTHNIGYSATLQPDSPFHWALIRPQVANDLETARNATVGRAGAQASSLSVEADTVKSLP